MVVCVASSSVTDNELVLSATGESSTAEMATVTACSAVAVPSETVIVKLSDPFAFAVGV